MQACRTIACELRAFDTDKNSKVGTADEMLVAGFSFSENGAEEGG